MITLMLALLLMTLSVAVQVVSRRRRARASAAENAQLSLLGSNPAQLVHGKLLDDTRLCLDGYAGFATVFMSLVDCPSCIAAARVHGIDVRRCRACGCTDDRACAGGCWWLDPDLCSACAR